MLKFMIVDDEPLAHELIEEFCSMLPHVELVKNCYSAMEALQFLNSSSVDFMFLDINMPKLKGLDFLRTLTKPPKTIITTAYKEYALEGFDLNVVDYLLKPFSFDRLVQAINKISSQEPSRTKVEVIPKQTESNRFFIKGDKKYHQIDINQILYIEAFGNYSKIFLKDEMIVSHDKISNYESLLSNSNLLRVHKSFIVAVDKIRFIQGNRIIIQEHEIPVGQTYKANVNNLL